MPRDHLPSRRILDSFVFEWTGVTYHASVGRNAIGEIAEIFLDAAKPGSGVNIMGKDAAVVFSLARQFGVPLSTIEAALSQESNGSACGPLGVALQLAKLEPEQREKALLKLVPPPDSDTS